MLTIVEQKTVKPDHPIRQMLCSLLLLSISTVSWSAELDHEPLQRSDSLSFTEIFSSALQNAPEALETDVRQAQADAYTGMGNGLLANRPSLQLSHNDDGLLDNIGLRETEYGLQLPLWRPGERKDSQNLGATYQEQVSQWQTYLALYIAGRVRGVLADIAAADTLLGIEQQAVADAEQLLAVSESLFTAGELSRLEVMQVQNQLLEQRKNLLDAEAMVVDAEREYQVLTGLNTRPNKTFIEELTSQEDITAAHPVLQLLQSEIKLADANIKQAEIAAKGNPVLSIGSRRERGDRFQPFVDSVNLAVSIPLGGKSIVSARSSTARRQKVDVEVNYQNTYRQLNRELHEAEHQLFLLESRIALSAEQAELSKTGWQMALTAFELGEATQAQVVAALQLNRKAEQEYQTYLLDQQRLISEFNQIVGVMP